MLGRVLHASHKQSEPEKETSNIDRICRTNRSATVPEQQVQVFLSDDRTRQLIAQRRGWQWRSGERCSRRRKVSLLREQLQGQKFESALSCVLLFEVSDTHVAQQFSATFPPYAHSSIAKLLAIHCVQNVVGDLNRADLDVAMRQRSTRDTAR